MSGIRVFNFREGDRSEYLANYLLSGLGLVTAVTRQEDIGFDFYCQLADQESGNLSFGYPFIIQVKSEGVKNIIYGESDPNKWRKENIEWLFRLEIPLFIGIVSKKEMQLEIYNTSPLNFIFFENPNPSILELKFENIAGRQNIPKPIKQRIKDWPNGKGDGYKSIIDLVNPIITIDNEDIHDIEKLRQKKNALKSIVFLEQENYLYRKLCVPYFRWVTIIETNQYFKAAWTHLTPANFDTANFYKSSLAHCLISLAINLKTIGQKEIALELKPILKRIQPEIIPAEIKKDFPDLFD